MKAETLDTQRAPNAWYAIKDARMQNIAYQSTYSQAQQVAADRMAMVMPMLYNTKGVHINYRKKFIAIKLEEPVIKDRKGLKLLEADYVKAGIIKKISEQGIVYRIPRK
jgi:hypothetical protein